MAKIIKTFLFIVTILLVGFYVYKYNRDFQEIEDKRKESQISESSGVNSVATEDKEYAFVWTEIDNLENLYLYPNFQEKYTLEEGIDNYHCKTLSSAGFYSKDDTPIGLFISEEEVISNKINSTLFNGYFILTKNQKAIITEEYGDDVARVGIQAGPLLIKDGRIQDLKDTNDEMARRVIVALSDKNELFFIAFYTKDSVFLGPSLRNLPSLIVKAQEEMNTQFVSALNLDGGSASAFYNQDIILSELTPIGSFFCEK